LFRALADDEAEQVVRQALAQGIEYFDTAPHYGNGLSEQRIGAALQSVDRDSLLVSTKVGRLLIDDANAAQEQNSYVDLPPRVQRYDYTRDGTLRSIEQSLARLRIERVDLVYVHDIDVAMHAVEHAHRFAEMLDGALPALEQLKASGSIAGYGLGVNGVEIALTTLAHADLDLLLIAGRYTLADQTALQRLLPECERRGVAVVVGGPFNSGILATGATPEDGSMPYFDYAPAPSAIMKRVSAIEKLCAEFGVPLKAAALQFPRAHRAVAGVLAGARTVAEVRENVALSRRQIPRTFWLALRERCMIDPAAPIELLFEKPRT
jgi:D-threo-aldose 1-dehydrogenase